MLGSEAVRGMEEEIRSEKKRGEADSMRPQRLAFTVKEVRSLFRDLGRKVTQSNLNF